MKKLLWVVLFFCSANAFAQKNRNQILITNTSFIDVKTGRVYAPSNVYIKKGVAQITNKKINNNIPLQQIIGTGTFFMPALQDMHVHFPKQNAERFFKLQSAAGIANCRIMKSNDHTVAFFKNAAISNSEVYLPIAKISYNFFGNETYGIDSIANVIKTLTKNGYHFIKIFGVKNEAQFDAIMASAKANNIMVCGHAISNVSAKKVLASGYRSIEHVGYFDKAKTPQALDSLLALAVQNNVFVCPTLDWVTMAYQAANKDSFAYRGGYEIGNKIYGAEWDTTYANNTKQLGEQAKQYKEYAKNDIAKKIEILKKMRAKGIKIIAGSDAEEPYQTPGYSLIDELKLIQKAGYTNAELLQMVTTNADLFWQNTSPKSDFILLNKNPLLDIGNLLTVQYIIKSNYAISTKALLQDIK